MLTEPAAVVYRALSRTAVSPGCRVLVIGDGTIALLAVLLARLWSPAEIAVLGRRAEQADAGRGRGGDELLAVHATPAPRLSTWSWRRLGATAAGETALAKVRRGGTVAAARAAAARPDGRAGGR